MMPVVATFKRTAAQIFGYSLLVAAVSLVFGWTAGMGPLYWVSAVVLGVVFCVLALRVVATTRPRRGPCGCSTGRSPT